MSVTAYDFFSRAIVNRNLTGKERSKIERIEKDVRPEVELILEKHDIQDSNKPRKYCSSFPIPVPILFPAL